jgi:hypothetical protein
VREVGGDLDRDPRRRSTGAGRPQLHLLAQAEPDGPTTHDDTCRLGPIDVA